MKKLILIALSFLLIGMCYGQIYREFESIWFETDSIYNNGQDTSIQGSVQFKKGIMIFDKEKSKFTFRLNNGNEYVFVASLPLCECKSKYYPSVDIESQISCHIEVSGNFIIIHYFEYNQRMKFLIK